jgi:hypothetical protein
MIELAPGLILVLVSLGLALGAAGCIEREGRPVNPCTNVTVAQAIEVTNVDKVDLLFLVDNSNSMDQEQAALIAEFPSLIRILTSGDFDQDGALDGPNDFEAVKDLNVGVITSDMGTGGFTVPTCARSDFGDDGILRTQGNTAAGCMATYPAFLNFRTGGDSDAFATQVACVAVTGTGGCGFEQQLEAVLKAASPSAPTSWTAPGYTAPMFFQNTFGHADRENDGFIRDNSVLALIPVTDEEDCSARDPELFNPSSATYGGTDLNLRCFAHADAALHPISRFVDGFLQLRTRPGLLIYAPITGIPQDLAPPAGERPNYDALVSPDPTVRDDRMEERVDPAMPTRLLTSCTGVGGSAFPPVRMVRVAQELQNRGAGVTVQSICEDSYSGALSEIIRQIASALSAACLPRRLNLEANGTVSCDVVAVLPPAMSDCAGIGGEPKVEGGAPVLEDGRNVCVLTQLVPADRTLGGAPPAGMGWYYDNYTSELIDSCGADSQRIAFTTQPPPGTTVRLECFQSVQGGGAGIVVGTFCDPLEPEMMESSALNPCGGGSDPAMRPDSLDCDPVSRACGVPCTIDSDCVDASLVGFVCDTRPLEVVNPDGFTGNTAPYNFCVNPTCG